MNIMLRFQFPDADNNHNIIIINKHDNRAGEKVDIEIKEDLIQNILLMNKMWFNGILTYKLVKHNVYIQITSS